MHPTAQPIKSPRPMNFSRLHVLGSGLAGDTRGELDAGGLEAARERVLHPPLVRVGPPLPGFAASCTKPAPRDHAHRRLLLVGRLRGVMPEAGASAPQPQFRPLSNTRRDQSLREAVPLDFSKARLTGRQA